MISMSGSSIGRHVIVIPIVRIVQWTKFARFLCFYLLEIVESILGLLCFNFGLILCQLVLISIDC